MKNFVKSFMAIAVFAMTLSLASCGDDDDNCFECASFEDTNGNTIPSAEFCEGTDDGNGNSLTAAQVNGLVAGVEAQGGTCQKK